MVRGGPTTADPSLPPRLWRGGRTEQRLRRAEREVGGRFEQRGIADTNGLFTEVDRKTSSGVMGLIIDALAREEPLEENASAREIGPGVLRVSPSRIPISWRPSSRQTPQQENPSRKARATQPESVKRSGRSSHLASTAPARRIAHEGARDALGARGAPFSRPLGSPTAPESTLGAFGEGSP